VQEQVSLLAFGVLPSAQGGLLKISAFHTGSLPSAHVPGQLGKLPEGHLLLSWGVEPSVHVHVGGFAAVQSLEGHLHLALVPSSHFRFLRILLPLALSS